MTTQQKMTEAEQALQEWNVAYMKQDDGTIFVEGDIDIRSKGLTKLPDLTNVIVKGNFNCQGNRLTSLVGTPLTVGRDFSCYDNCLTSLAGAPTSVGGSFYCSNNRLTSLAGAPSSVDGHFYCFSNRLTTLAGAPTSVTGFFSCADNQLTTLAGAPASVGGDFHCFINQLTTLVGAPTSIDGGFHCRSNLLTVLEGAPQKFKVLESDFGDFASWDDVPEHLRVSAETKEKERQLAEKRHQEMLRKIAAAGEKKQVFKPARSIRFKLPPK